MNKCLSIITENGLERIANSNSTATAIKLALLQEQANQGFNWNTKEVIEESGEWVAPVTGWYDITAIGGGWGGLVTISTLQVYGGRSGKYVNKIKFFNKGDVVNVSIGAGGIGGQTINDSVGGNSLDHGGETIFGDISTETVNNCFPMNYGVQQPNGYMSAYPGSGFGGGSVHSNINSDDTNGKWYGAGGAACLYRSNSTFNCGNGSNGCVIICYYDPSKTRLPTIDEEVLTPYIELLKRMDSLEEILAKSCVYNEEALITESGTWTAPVTGVYEVTLINGGWGAFAYTNVFKDMWPGDGNAPQTKLIKINKGQQVPVTIGAGGIGTSWDTVTPSTIPTTHVGGVTSFGDFSVPHNKSVMYGYFYPSPYRTINGKNYKMIRGGGIGGGVNNRDSNEANNAKNYGAGGGGFYDPDVSPTMYVGDGMQGCIKIRWYNPDK